MLVTNADANRIAGIVKYWHTAIAVGTHGDVRKRNAGIEGCFGGLARFYSIFGAGVTRVDS